MEHRRENVAQPEQPDEPQSVGVLVASARGTVTRPESEDTEQAEDGRDG